jgi:hypothetical protein
VVLQRRVEYIEQKIAEDKARERGTGYFFGRGIGLTIEDLRAFTNSLQAVFINSGEVSLWIGNLANHDIRRCLQLTREIVASPYIEVHDLLKAGLTHTTLNIDLEKAKAAIIKGKYDIYPEDLNKFVRNIYALTTEVVTSPLLGLRIVQLLEDTRFQHSDGEKRYVEIENITEFFNAMNIEPRVTQAWLDKLLEGGLILSYDPTVAEMSKVNRLEISPSGSQHLLWGTSDWVYIESMLEVTPLLDRETHHEIRVQLDLGVAAGRRKAIRSFLLYLLDEDSRYCAIPDHASYSGQKRLSTRFEQQCRALAMPMRSSGSNRYGRSYGRIISWDAEHGFGFIGPEGGGPDAYANYRDIVHEGIDSLPIGR